MNEFREAVQARASDLTEQWQLGIAIDNCEVESKPPRQLQDVFDQVTDRARKTAASCSMTRTATKTK